MLDFSYEKISSLLPSKVISTTSSLLAQGGFQRITARSYIGFSLFFSLSLALTSFFLVQFFTQNEIISIIVPIAVFGLFETLFYILLVATADARANQIEQVLPHALQIIAANIRAGMTLENAIWGAARPEFGPLQEEVQKVSADVFGGVSIQKAFSRLTQRVRSSITDRAVKLIVQGISLGGEMANLLEEVSHDIRTVQRLKNEVATSTTTYSFFIVFAAVLVSPMLFSISVYYSEINSNVFQARTTGAQVDQAASQRSGISGVPAFAFGSTKNSIKVEDIRLFAIAAIAITSMFSAFILALIRSGKAASGIFYAPLFAIISISIFFASSAAMRALLSPVFR